MKNIEPFLFFYSLGVFIFYPLSQQILFKVICIRTFNSTIDICNMNLPMNDLIQKETSKWTLYLNIGCIFPALFIPILCSTIGPIVGSHRLLFLPLIGDTLSFAFMALYENISTFPNWLLVVCLSLVNIIGGHSVARALCNNYVSASVSFQNREKRFLLLEIICMSAYTLSGVVGGYIIYYLSYRIGIYTCFALVMIGLIFLIFTKNVEIKPLKKSFFQNESYFNVMKETLYGVPKNNRGLVVLFLISEFFTTFAEYGAIDILVIYCLRSEFQLSSLNIGWILSATHAAKAIGSLLIYPLFMQFFKTPGWVLSLINQFFIIGYFLMFAFAKTKIEIIFSAIFFLFKGSVAALISTSLSKSCEGKSRGMIFGFHSTITEVGSVLGGVFADFVYLITLNIFPGLTYLLLGCIMLIGCTLGSVALYLQSKNQNNDYQIIVFNEEDFVLIPENEILNKE